MRLYAKWFLMTTVLVAPLMLYGQEHFHLSDPNLLARFSFNSGAPGLMGGGHTCIAVDRDGSFRMMRTNENLRMIGTLNLEATSPIVILEENGRIRRLPDSTERLEGTLSREQLLQFETLVRSSDLRPLVGNHFALVRQSAETFTAEIPISDKQASDGTLHVHLINADGQNPFPVPVRKIVDWLNQFEPANAKHATDLEFQDVCPSIGLQFIQPIASNIP
jgi:hypothetical protein